MTPPSALRVLRAGPLTTVQDRGRPGLASMGVGRSGPADRGSHDRANRLAGNGVDAATLEVTMGGFVAEATGTLWVAVTGAPSPVTVDGTPRGVDSAFLVERGQRIAIELPARGVRTYLAVRGGLDVPPVLGSRATDTLARLGPDPLADGDVLTIGDRAGAFPALDYVPVLHPPAEEPVLLGFDPGPRDDWFAPEAMAMLESLPWTVNPASNRIGVRLDGPELARAISTELPSEGVALGSIQVPPSGPVVFLADHPVTGGYPVIGVLDAASIDRAAQLRAGDLVAFRRRSRTR